MPKPTKSRKQQLSSVDAAGRALSRAEVIERARAFALRWEGKDGIRPAKEESHKQTWWRELFHVYGIAVEAVATFEYSVPNVRGHTSSIDLFFPGVCIAEHKSRGCSERQFEQALKQAVEYVQDLARTGESARIPPFLIVSDFERVRVYDLRQNVGTPAADFLTIDLGKRADALMFLRGSVEPVAEQEESADFKAVRLVGRLHDALEAGGYRGHRLEIFLVRCLFCMFADDTELFERSAFHDIVRSSRPDGSDLGALLAHAFEVLDTPTLDGGRREPMPPPLFASLPYVNGALFSEKLGFATFDERTREALLRCCEFDWANISPAIFGSLFQAVMDSKERRNFGAHYTSESDIMKVIRPLFLDDLERELADCGNRTAALHEFHDKICSLRFLDPACGCGNFLIVAYKHIRRLEHLCLERLQAASTKANRAKHGMGIDPSRMRVAQSQFFGIELSEWAARIAEVALILSERQEDIKLAHAITFRRLPLRRNATIRLGNALELDWNSVLPAAECSYILGNPPYVGKKERSDSQRVDMERCWGNTAGVHTLDYVTCWYDRAAHYMHGTSTRAAFVSTKSICQGQQASIMWGNLFGRGLHIHFAHRTFKWRSDAPHAASVSVVIVGFGYDNPAACHIFDYSGDPQSPARLEVARIDQYLSDSIATPQIKTRQQPLCAVPKMHYGSQAIDQDRSDPEGSGLVVTEQQRRDLLLEEPRLEPYIRPFIGTSELVSGKPKYCLWLKDAPLELLRTSSQLKSRLEHVRAFRMGSNRSQTKRLASTPYLFGGDLQPPCRYLLIPKVSSQNRHYLPMAFMPPEVIASGSALVIEEAPEYVFGVLSSVMHMAWLRGVGGRFKSDYQYSAQLVYNNFPFPQGADSGRIESVERAATKVLSARAAAGSVTLESLYDPLTMPTALVDAHSELDQAVDRCYRRERFESDSARLQHLFDLYQRLATPLTSESPKRRRAKAKRGDTILE